MKLTEETVLRNAIELAVPVLYLAKRRMVSLSPTSIRMLIGYYYPQCGIGFPTRNMVNMIRGLSTTEGTLRIDTQVLRNNFCIP